MFCQASNGCCPPAPMCSVHLPQLHHTRRGEAPYRAGGTLHEAVNRRGGGRQECRGRVSGAGWQGGGRQLNPVCCWFEEDITGRSTLSAVVCTGTGRPMARSCAGIRTTSCGEWRTGWQVWKCGRCGKYGAGCVVWNSAAGMAAGCGTREEDHGKDSYGHCCGSLAWMVSCVEKSEELFPSTFPSKHLHPRVCSCPSFHPVSMDSCPSSLPSAL